MKSPCPNSQAYHPPSLLTGGSSLCPLHLQRGWMSPPILFSVEKSTSLRNPLVAQWLGFSVLTASNQVQWLVGELRTHKPSSQKSFKSYKSPQSLAITSLMPTHTHTHIHTHTHTHTHTRPSRLANNARTGSQKQQKHQHLQKLASHHTSLKKDMTLPFLSPPRRRADSA